MDKKIPKQNSAEKLKRHFVFLLSRHFVWLVIFLAFLVIAFGFIFFLKPEYDKIIAVAGGGKKEVEEQKNELMERKRYLKDLNESLAVYEKISPKDIEKINLLLPEKELAESLFTRLDNLVARNGLILTSMKINQDSATQGPAPGRAQSTDKESDQSEQVLPSGIGVISVDLSIAGCNYEAIKNLLRALENNLRIMDVDKLSFSSGGDSLNLSIRTYYLKK